MAFRKHVHLACAKQRACRKMTAAIQVWKDIHGDLELPSQES